MKESRKVIKNNFYFNKMQNKFSFMMMAICIALSIFCLYKIVTVQTSIIRINYISLLIFLIFFSFSYYNEYISITVVVTRVDDTFLYYKRPYFDGENRLAFDPKQNINVRVGDTIVLYLKDKDYYLPNKNMYNGISFGLLLVCACIFMYTKINYPDDFKTSGL